MAAMDPGLVGALPTPAVDPRVAILAKLFAGAGGNPGAPVPTGIPPTAAAAPAGMTKPQGPTAGGPPMPTGAKAPQSAESTSDTPPGVTPPLSEQEYAAKNPGTPTAPYIEPSLKQRMLMGIFAAMMNQGQRGSGTQMENEYLNRIYQGEQQNKTQPAQDAAAAHQRYMSYMEGQKAPLDIKAEQGEIAEKAAQTDADKALAEQRRNPQNQAKLQRAVITGPNGEPQSADFNSKTGQYSDPDTGKVIEGAKPWEKPTAPKSPQSVMIDGKPGFAVLEPGKGWTDVNGQPIKGNVEPPPTFAETGLYDTINAVDPASGNIVPATLDRRTRTVQGFGAGGGKNLVPIPPGAEKEIGPALADAREADKRLTIMQQNETDALKGNQQAMLSIVANHIGMTLGAQKGARINQAVWNEAIESAPVLARAEARFDKNGYLTGVTLTPDQVKQMVALGKTVDDANWKKATDTFSQYGIPFKRPGGGGNTPQYSHTATDAKGNKVGWDGSKWVPISGQQ